MTASDETETPVPVVDRKTGKEVASKGATVIDWATGEHIELAPATTDRLGEVIENASAVRAGLAEVERDVSNELIARLDRDASWTWRGAGGLKISAPSPDKGTEDFPLDALEACLLKLIEDETISPDGASKAMKRQITLTVDVPLGTALKPLVEMFKDWKIEIDEAEMPVVKVDESVSKVAAGIAKLRKIPAAKVALAAAAGTKDPPPRKVKVERL